MRVIAITSLLLLGSCSRTSVVTRNCSTLPYDDFGPYCAAVLKKTSFMSQRCEISIVKSKDDSNGGYGNYLGSPIDGCTETTYSFEWTDAGLKIKSDPSAPIEVAISVPKASFTGGR